MKWGLLRLWCSICGECFIYDANHPGPYFRHKMFGILNSKECYDNAEIRYARHILGKDDA